ncbi:unnamed protein product [Rotaria sordida]|uniref:RRM domain-containing protein n=2 Tax=Rotaria sordida TaxID=392033 RepID=A0A815BDT4_9BILA|nr:unnamed protein product [Rotaria sordida]CAF1266256.1 unnamed protein product [Rotaria sordida]
MDEEKLCKLFSTYGTVTDYKIARDQYNRSKGFGFVSFLQSSMAENAVANLNNLKLDNGKNLYVCFLPNKQNHHKKQRETYIKSYADRNISMSYMNGNIDDRKLNETFTTNGKIRSATVTTIKDQSQDYGFVNSSTTNEAIDDMNGKELNSKSLDVKTNKSSKKSRVSAFHRYTNITSFTRSQRSSSASSSLSRLSTRIHSLFKDHPFQYETVENSNINRRSSSSNSLSIEFNQEINHRKNTTSNNENEKHESEI